MRGVKPIDSTLTEHLATSHAPDAMSRVPNGASHVSDEKSHAPDEKSHRPDEKSHLWDHYCPVNVSVYDDKSRHKQGLYRI